MISPITFEQMKTLRSLSNPTTALMKAHSEFTERKLTEALIAKFGKLPSLEDVAKHCVCAYTPDHVAHYFWFDGEKPKLGEKFDLSQALVAIAPPKIFNPEKPKS